MSVLSRKRSNVAIATVLIALATTPLNAQLVSSGASLHGYVRDQSGSPVAFALITVRDVRGAADIRGVADSAGRFLIENLGAGSTSILVRRLGFTPRRVSMTLVEGRAPVEL